MKVIVGLAALVAIPLMAGAAFAGIPDDEIGRLPFHPPTSQPVYASVDTTRIQAAVKFRPPPLQLPDYRARMTRVKAAARIWLAPQLKKSRQVIAFFENPKHRWILATRKAKCWDVPWQRECTLARAKLRLHHALAEEAQWRLDHELPLINDWKTAVSYVQRIYPGTESWLLYISDREGGYGPWVWYGGRHWSGYHIGNDYLGMDTVGGWMQFRFSTFEPYYLGMVKDMRSRGYVLPAWPNRGGPAIYQPWLDPLAQALTAGYMRYYGKDGCHWCL